MGLLQQQQLGVAGHAPPKLAGGSRKAVGDAVERLHQHRIGTTDAGGEAASVVRSMFTHGSRSDIIGSDVTACTRGGAGVRLTHHLGDARPELARGAQLRDRHELIVVGGIAETDLPQRIRHRDATFSEQPQVGNRRPRRCRPVPTTRSAPVVECRAVDGDRAHSAAESGDFRRGRRRRRPRSAAGRALNGAVNGSAPGPPTAGSADPRPDRSAGDQRLSGGDIVGAGSTTTGTRSRNTPSSSRSSSAGGHTPGPPTRSTSALTPSVKATNSAPFTAVGRRGSAGGKRFGDLPAGLDVAQRVTTPDIGPPPGQRRLRQRVQAGVQRADRETLVGRRIQQPLRLSGQVGLPPGALRQHRATAERHRERLCWMLAAIGGNRTSPAAPVHPARGNSPEGCHLAPDAN